MPANQLLTAVAVTKSISEGDMGKAKKLKTPILPDLSFSFQVIIWISFSCLINKMYLDKTTS